MKWTAADDAALLQAMQGSTRKEVSWVTVAESVPGKNADQVRLRWLHSADPSIKKGPFSRAEDVRLKELYAIYGNQWTSIAENMIGRRPRQIRTRWCRTLDPALTFTAWTATEDEKLTTLVSLHGQSWAVIADLLGNRSDIQVRKR